MKDSKKVSVIVPCYNVEKYIDQCLDSICSQTYTNLEILCVDDGSKDHTCMRIEERMKKDGRIHLYRQENLYAGVARNTGMQKAIGDYICFFDADDFFDTQMIEQMMSTAVETCADIVLCDAYFYDDVTEGITEPLWVLNHKILKRCGKVFSCEDIPDEIFELCWGVPWNKLIRKEFLDRTGLKFQAIKRHNDEYFASMALVMAERISWVDRRFVYYRRNVANSLQAYTGEVEKEYGFYKALAGIKNDLEEIGACNQIKKSFQDKCLYSCVNLLKKQRNYAAYENLYNFLKTTAFQEFGISDTMQTKYKAALSEYRQIMQKEAGDYLLSKAYEENNKQKFIFPFYLVENSRNIALYAAGRVGREYYKQLMEREDYCIAAWFDKGYEKLRQRGFPVVNPKDVMQYQFEKIVIAVDDKTIAEEIRHQLVQDGVLEDKIVWK